MRKALLIGAALIAILPAAAFARGRAVVIVGPAFGPYGWYGWYGPYYDVYPYGPYGKAAGEVKLDSNVKDAEVYINGNYAGTVKKLKTLMLSPGAYDISVRAPGRESFDEKIYIVAGKTLKLHPDLRVQNTPQPPTD